MTRPSPAAAEPIERPKTTGTVRALDGLRGLAVLAVVLFHTGELPFGWIGVPTFFVLSGHFVTRVLLERRSGPRPLRDFFRNRLLRLAPLYLVACAGLTVFAFTRHAPRELRGDLPFVWTWSYNLRILFPGYVDQDIYGHLWSLGVEVQLYAVWALLTTVLSRTAFRRCVIILALSGPLVRAVVAMLLMRAGFPHAALPAITYVLPTSYLDAFAIGACTALPEVRGWLWRARRTTVAPVAAALLAVCTVQLLLSHPMSAGRRNLRDLDLPIELPLHSRWVWEYSLLAVLAGVATLTALRGGRFARMLSWRPLAWLGLISYGIYVFHAPMADVELTLLGYPRWSSGPAVLGALVVLALSVLLAAVSFRYLEKPFLAFKRGGLRSPARPGGP